MAALIGVAYFINSELEEQTSQNIDMLFTPHYQSWYATEKVSAQPIPVKIASLGKIDLPDSSHQAAVKLLLRQNENRFLIFSEQNIQLPIGYLDRQDIAQAGLNLTVQDHLSNFIVTDRLVPSTVNYNLDPLPFFLTTQTYSQEYSRYTLYNQQNENVHIGSIYRKQTEIVYIDGHYYLIAVIEVNHHPASGEPYAKFAVGEIKLMLD